MGGRDLTTKLPHVGSNSYDRLATKCFAIGLLCLVSKAIKRPAASSIGCRYTAARRHTAAAGTNGLKSNASNIILDRDICISEGSYMPEVQPSSVFDAAGARFRN